MVTHPLREAIGLLRNQSIASSVRNSTFNEGDNTREKNNKDKKKKKDKQKQINSAVSWNDGGMVPVWWTALWQSRLVTGRATIPGLQPVHVYVHSVHVYSDSCYGVAAYAVLP